jgi:hypothetical protein
MTSPGKSCTSAKIFFALQFNARGVAKLRNLSVKHLTASETFAATRYTQSAASARSGAIAKSRCKTLAFAKSRA